jgi:peptide maturation system protein (TIGR04066 family)
VACVDTNCLFENYNGDKLDNYNFDFQVSQEPSLQEIYEPIVAVAGLWEDIDKFEVSLVLREKFLANGYSITQVGSRNCCELFGFHSFPIFMYDSTLDAVTKVIYFNRWVKQLSITEKPDVIIITIPGAVQNFSERFTKGFGVLPHLVFQAVVADFLVFCTMYNNSSTKFLDEVSTMCKYRYGSEVDCYHMSNLLFDLNASKERGKVIKSRVFRDMVTQALDEDLKDNEIPIFNLLDSSSWDKLYDLVENKLSNEQA